jgi:transcription initiation factor TFIID subunit 13
LRKDPRKYARAKDLLIMNEELKKARKAFEENAKY